MQTIMKNAKQKITGRHLHNVKDESGRYSSYKVSHISYFTSSLRNVDEIMMIAPFVYVSLSIFCDILDSDEFC
jgi:hypothetical protein